MSDVDIRTARPSDHARIIAVCDDWWGRPISGVLPRLFLDHFHTSSLTAEFGEELAGFLVGFASPSEPEEAYVHFVGVAPEHRRSGLASRLYERFTAAARAEGRTVVRAITSPVNERSIAFHRAFGFEVTGPHADYEAPGVDRMVFELRL
ncbi:GNAT family N-acetyltransferase [Nocardiopsis sp. EMB25]|uniref:GNAT family N-acetyltransferase n=1 Tax=Nocardiopsis TaxID=2013 RepID=UPI000344BEA0|nr:MULTISPECIES: GNAT family N-acetyltransferase [Nocardiopsis]MCY9786427.1 GNAT family N-acetyltransferase [Nocardiopsis sp. EMB25]